MTMKFKAIAGENTLVIRKNFFGTYVVETYTANGKRIRVSSIGKEKEAKNYAKYLVQLGFEEVA